MNRVLMSILTGNDKLVRDNSEGNAGSLSDTTDLFLGACDREMIRRRLVTCKSNRKL